MRKRLRVAALLALAAAGMLALPSWAQEVRVRAVLFYSPTCPHCHLVIEGTILPLIEQFGDQFEVLAVDTSTPEGIELFQSAMREFDVPAAQWGVPALVIADRLLVGSYDIPAQLPSLVETGLAQGGIDWPEIPGLRELLAAAEADQSESTAELTDPNPDPPQVGAESDADEQNPGPLEAVPDDPAGPTPVLESATAEASLTATIADRLQRDPAGNAISILVLIGMVLSLPASLKRAFQRPAANTTVPPDWAVPMLAMLGLLVAAYMAFVETTGAEAICGPVGDCNAVQQSEYAVLFGVLPVGVLGVLGYLAILAVWAVSRLATGALVNLAYLALLGMTGFGVLFSIYLTLLEPFVIGASCAWCLSSAIIITALMWLVGPGAIRPIDQLVSGPAARDRAEGMRGAE